MIELLLIGIGTGNPDHLTLQAIKALNSADLILIPRKGKTKADLAELRRAICTDVLTNPAVRLAEFDLPVRDAANPDYRAGVDDWHDAIADSWRQAIRDGLGTAGRVALLVWGDPSLYDSTLRIAGRVATAPSIHPSPPRLPPRHNLASGADRVPCDPDQRYRRALHRDHRAAAARRRLASGRGHDRGDAGRGMFVPVD